MTRPRGKFQATEIRPRVANVRPRATVSEPSTQTLTQTQAGQDFSEAIKTLQMDMGYCRLNQPYSPALLEERVFQVRSLPWLA